MPLMTDAFRTKHILQSNDPQIDQIAEAMERCRTRHRGQMVTANTVICLTNLQLSILEMSQASPWRNKYLSPTVPLAVRMSAVGTLTAVTNTQFTYGLDYSKKISHFEPNPGLVGGASTQLGIIRALDLDGIRIYSGRKFPDTRGFTAHGASGVLTGATRAHNGDTFSETRLIHSPTSQDNVGKTFFAKQGDLQGAARESWIQWGTDILQI